MVQDERLIRPGPLIFFSCAEADLLRHGAGALRAHELQCYHVGITASRDTHTEILSARRFPSISPLVESRQSPDDLVMVRSSFALDTASTRLISP